MGNKKKKDGVIYTPRDVVERMLNMSAYYPEKDNGILEMDVMDNSCGDGNILVIVTERMCKALNEITQGYDDNERYNYFLNHLVSHIHGMELNGTECSKCVKRLNEVVANHLNCPVDWKWDIKQCNSLTVIDNRKFNFVICNPPYVRTHDLEENDLTGYSFAEDGMKDLYIAFYELGLRQVKDNGTMCYITPSSWFTSGAGKKLREYLFENHMISEIYDYGHTQVFENATTYVEITVIHPSNAKTGQNYVTYGGVELGEEKIRIPYPTIELEGKFYFTDPANRHMLNDISLHHKGNIKVKNGFATLADDVFIRNEKPCDSEYVIPIVKSSTGKRSWCIYPYDKTGKFVDDEFVLSLKAPQAMDILLDNKGKLLDRSTDEPWYAFGRTQAINDTYKDKWTIKSLIKTVDDINPVKAEAGVGVYGGLYILCDGPEQLECLKTEEFLNYVKSLRKYKSGGYYTFSSKDLENYLNWKNRC